MVAISSSCSCSCSCDYPACRSPMLVVPDHWRSQRSETEEAEDDHTCPIFSATRSLYCVFHKKLLQQFQIQLPEATQRFFGSSLGWHINATVDDQNILHVTLFNPFSSSGTINLRPVTKHIRQLQTARDIDDGFTNNLDIWSNQYVSKAVLTCDPASNPDDYVVAIIYGQFQRLAVIRPSTDATWTYYPEHNKEDQVIYVFQDVISDYDKIYPVNHEGSVFCCETNDDDNAAHCEDWMETKCLDDSALFIGDNTSTCMRAFDLPGCIPNSIYCNHDSNPVTTPLG